MYLISHRAVQEVVHERTYGVVRRRERRHFVPIPCILKVEQLDLVRDLPRRKPCAPFVHQLREDAVRPTLLHLSQPPKHRKLIIRHTLVSLSAAGQPVEQKHGECGSDNPPHRLERTSP